MSDFFLHENILIKYWVDQCSKYELHGNKIKSAIANIPLSITPDIKENIFEDGTKQPCEIKWTTSGFTDPNQISKVASLNGFLLVFKKDKLDCPEMILNYGFKKIQRNLPQRQPKNFPIIKYLKSQLFI